MKKIHFNCPLRDLKGDVVLDENKEPVLLGSRIAELFYYGNNKNPLKYHNWALKLHNKEHIEVSEHDAQEIKSVIENADSIVNFVKVAAINVIDDGNTKPPGGRPE